MNAYFSELSEEGKKRLTITKNEIDELPYRYGSIIRVFFGNLVVYEVRNNGVLKCYPENRDLGFHYHENLFYADVSFVDQISPIQKEDHYVYYHESNNYIEKFILVGISNDQQYGIFQNEEKTRENLKFLRFTNLIRVQERALENSKIMDYVNLFLFSYYQHNVAELIAFVLFAYRTKNDQQIQFLASIMSENNQNEIPRLVFKFIKKNFTKK